MLPRISQSLALAVGVAALPLLAARPVPAQEAPPSPLPLRDVVLFSSGVGYFDRSGRVVGDATLDLSFRAEQINDILKSLVLFDPGGTVRPVTYATQQPALQRHGVAGRAIDSGTTLGTLLRGFQGAQVRLQVGGPEVEGRIVSVHNKLVSSGQGTPVPVEVLNVLTADGLRALPLDSVSTVRLLDARLDRELRTALEMLATGLNDQRRPVTLRFSGNGAREVRAAYLQEMPVWKTSYRLVLDSKEKPFLQGWGHVENTTDEDWNEVRLSLVSGRPVSFIQDLYQPLYVPRPVVTAQVVGSPLPQTYGETLALEGRDAAGAPGLGGGGGFGGPAGPPAAAAPEALQRGAARMPKITGSANLGFDRAQRERFGMEMARAVAAQAEGEEKGDLFEYAIKNPVTLAKGQAAMVPIISTAIEGERVSIFDADADTRRALHGFRLRNTTGLHLAGGPVTVFREGVYAGDAQIQHVQPREDRLLSYAVDLDLVADREEPKFQQQMLTVVARNGVMIVTRKQRRERVYTFRNKAQEAKTVLVQQRVEDDFKLVEPARPQEKTADEYRFSVPVPAGMTTTFKVVEERPLSEEIALREADLNMLVAYAQNGQVAEKLRAALKDLVARRGRITELQAQRARREGEIKEIGEEQSRIRQNMERLDRNSPLYQQYVTKLTQQETRIEQLRGEIARLLDEENTAQRELRAFIDSLTIQ